MDLPTRRVRPRTRFTVHRREDRPTAGVERLPAWSGASHIEGATRHTRTGVARLERLFVPVFAVAVTLLWLSDLLRWIVRDAT